MATTADWLALRGPVETQTMPSLGLEAHVRRARQAAEHAEDAAARLRFSAWVQTLRGLVEMEEEAAHALWVKAVDRSEWRFGAEEGR